MFFCTIFYSTNAKFPVFTHPVHPEALPASLALFPASRMAQGGLLAFSPPRILLVSSWFLPSGYEGKGQNAFLPPDWLKLESPMPWT